MRALKTWDTKQYGALLETKSLRVREEHLGSFKFTNQSFLTKALTLKLELCVNNATEIYIPRKTFMIIRLETIDDGNFS